MGVPVQIITPENHRFVLQLEDLKPIFEAVEVKDRYVVIVSVAGAFRKGKSFLLNFFLRYLQAQYKKHNVEDWIGESTDGAGMVGFEFAGGRKPKTTGIWMWSELFTHDYENGDKVAIILMDTQGIFDSRSNLMDNTTVFSISMMLSSVQCYNVMQNIQEDDLQHLELFTEYGRLALNQTSEKSFQKLMFLVRDWPNAFEMPYGDGQAFINELLAETPDQTNDMKQLRRRIKSSFDKVTAYLMPYPGPAVANGRNPNGLLSLMDADFVAHLKILVPSIFAPQNLIPKKISGEKIRVRDLVTYLQTYVNIFSGGTLPEPRTVLDATASTLLLILCTDCFNEYAETMKEKFNEISLHENQPYCMPLELKLISDDAKAASLLKFQNRQKIGTPQLIDESKTKLIEEIDLKFTDFVKDNDQKQSVFKAKALAGLRNLEVACFKIYDDKLQTSLNPTTPLSNTDLQQIHDTAKADSIAKFNSERKLGSEEMIAQYRERVESHVDLQYERYKQRNEATRQAIEDMKNKSEAEKAKALEDLRIKHLETEVKQREAEAKNFELLDRCVKAYGISVVKSVEGTNGYLNQSEMNGIHESAKAEAMSTFDRGYDDIGQNKASWLSRLESDLDTGFIRFSNVNEEKRKAIQAAGENEKMQEMIANMQEEMKKLRDETAEAKKNKCSIL